MEVFQLCRVARSSAQQIWISKSAYPFLQLPWTGAMWRQARNNLCLYHSQWDFYLSFFLVFSVTFESKSSWMCKVIRFTFGNGTWTQHTVLRLRPEGISTVQRWHMRGQEYEDHGGTAHCQNRGALLDWWKQHGEVKVHVEWHSLEPQGFTPLLHRYEKLHRHCSSSMLP